ncbi:ABC transporter permease [Enterocloster sp. OA13]|uniref:ABC transporter permease n=1 Tax=Enterocloster TaxID=2719313 RepID=UPI0004723795|nr:ABC transporter permease [Lachnoclostridium pacaense]MCH1952506.1 ABC transporter permease [Enterocloster sp. OA13]RJW35808.1 ABC transporter permease [Clostridiales bacterium TF09-2AC]
MNQILSIFTSTFSMSVPLILAALGGVISVRSGIMALGLESMMTMGAFCGVLGSYYTGNVAAAILCGVAGGALFGLCHGILSVRYKVNQVISGIGLNLLAVAATTLLMQLIWNNKGSSPQVASIKQGVLTSPITFIMLAAVAAEYFVLFRTRFGLRLRMVGENPKAAATVGLPVHRIKYIAVVCCGMLAGLGGAYLSIDHLDMYVRDMSAGRGYIAVAIMILARYNPIMVVLCALIFGFSDAVQISLQGYGVPSQIMAMIPYIVTLLVLAFGVRQITPPAGVGAHDDE